MLKVNPVTHSYGVSSICKCCGLFGMLGQVGAGAIQGATNITTTAMANKANKEIAEMTNEANLKLNKQNNEWNWLLNEENNKQNRLLAEEANALNLQMFQEQNDWNYNMWKENNAYNDPSAQMERLIAAGINPNMVGNAAGGSAAGNSNSSPESATFAGAQVAHMNPIQLEAGHIDPYRVAAVNADFLPALQAAAGIANTMADTRNKELKNDFDFDTLGSREEMENTLAQKALEELKDFQGSAGYRGSLRAVDIEQRRAYRDYMRTNKQLIDQTIQLRKDEWKWAKHLRPLEEKKLEETINNIMKTNEKMDSDMLLNEAQKHHWLAQEAIDATRNAIAQQQVDLGYEQLNTQNAQFNASFSEQKRVNNATIDDLRRRKTSQDINDALKLYDVRPGQRDAIADVLANQGLQGASEFVRGLKGAANGTYETIFLEIAKTIRAFHK